MTIDQVIDHYIATRVPADIRPRVIRRPDGFLLLGKAGAMRMHVMRCQCAVTNCGGWYFAPLDLQKGQA